MGEDMNPINLCGSQTSTHHSEGESQMDLEARPVRRMGTFDTQTNMNLFHV